jgi:hypothetical protein
VTGFWADTLRWLATVGALGLLAWVWYQIVSNLTPFDGSFTRAQVAAEVDREQRYTRLRQITVGLDVFFFAVIVIEGAVLPAYLFLHYGFR